LAILAKHQHSNIAAQRLDLPAHSLIDFVRCLRLLDSLCRAAKRQEQVTVMIQICCFFLGCSFNHDGYPFGFVFFASSILEFTLNSAPPEFDEPKYFFPATFIHNHVRK
jgi:hypothetical protein